MEIRRTAEAESVCRRRSLKTSVRRSRKSITSAVTERNAEAKRQNAAEGSVEFLAEENEEKTTYKNEMRYLQQAESSAIRFPIDGRSRL